MSDRFYRMFEERYRGPRDLIKRRLAVYLPFLKPLLDVYPNAVAIDLGCGRGEWLELLAWSGFKPVGVDLDADMLEACRGLSLEVEQGDALATLSGLPGESQVVVSAFHVVEHITFDQLRTLVAEALRVLKPGGLLIMETPNPENIVVATRDFYLDPTHERPIPSALLAFVAEHAGFARVKTLRLQESKELVNKGDVSLQDVFAGASPDYAVIAQKHASGDVLSLTSDAFNVDYGLSLENLMGRWDARFDRVEAKAKQAEAKAKQAEAKAEQAEAKAKQAEAKAEQAEAKAGQAEAKAEQANTYSQALLSSTSWRLTAPLRFVSHVGLRLLSAIPTRSLVSGLKRRARAETYRVARWVLSRPRLKQGAFVVLNRLPRLRQQLRRIFFEVPVTLPEKRAVANLTPRAASIHAVLIVAIENRKN